MRSLLKTIVGFITGKLDSGQPKGLSLPEPRWSDIISGNSQPNLPISYDDGFGVMYYNNGKPVAYHIK